MIYELTRPPAGARCCTPGDGTAAAVVRLTTPQVNGSALDLCEHCWPGLWQEMRSLGHRLVDTSCSQSLLGARYPAWKLMQSDAGRLYASARLHGSRQGTTVFAWTLAALRDEMARAEQPPGPFIRYFGGRPG